MAYIDLVTAAPHGFVLYADDETVVFWDRPGGESQMTRDEFSAPTIFPSEAPGWALLARVQALGPEPDPPQAVIDRRDQLAAYAASNGGSIVVHQSQDRPAGMASLAGRIRRGLFGGPADS